MIKPGAVQRGLRSEAVRHIGVRCTAVAHKSAPCVCYCELELQCFFCVENLTPVLTFFISDKTKDIKFTPQNE